MSDNNIINHELLEKAIDIVLNLGDQDKNDGKKDSYNAMVSLLKNSLPSVYETLYEFHNQKNFLKKTNHMTDDYFRCLKCNKKVVLLKKHLGQCHKMSIYNYIKEFNLDNDFPSVPKNYSRTRSNIAKEIKLGYKKKPI